MRIVILLQDTLKYKIYNIPKHFILVAYDLNPHKLQLTAIHRECALITKLTNLLRARIKRPQLSTIRAGVPCESRIIVVQLAHAFLGGSHVPEHDERVASIEPRVVHHQPQLVYLPHLLKHRDKLILVWRSHTPHTWRCGYARLSSSSKHRYYTLRTEGIVE